MPTNNKKQYTQKDAQKILAEMKKSFEQIDNACASLEEIAHNIASSPDVAMYSPYFFGVVLYLKDAQSDIAKDTDKLLTSIQRGKSVPNSLRHYKQLGIKNNKEVKALYLRTKRVVG